MDSCVERVAVWFVVFFGLVSIADADDSVILHGSRVGIVPFVYTAEEEGLVESVLSEMFRSYGVIATNVSSAGAGTLAEILLQDPTLDYVVSGTVTGTGEGRRATARVRVQGQSDVWEESFEGGRAHLDLCASVVEYASRKSVLLTVLKNRVPSMSSRYESNPADTEALMVLGLDAFHSGDWTRALDLLRKAGAEAPDICALHYYVSLCHKRLGDDIQRYAALERALECDSKSESAMIELGNYHLERGEFAEATARYKACLESPRVADLARWNLAVAYMRNDDVLAAKEALEGVRSTSPYAHSARVWSHRLNELSTSLDASGAAKRVNLLKRIGLPDVEIAIPVLLVGLGLLVSFLIPGLKTSAIDSSKVETKKGRARLRDVGLGMLAIGVVLLLPIVSTRVSSPLAALPELEASNQGLLEFLTPAMDN